MNSNEAQARIKINKLLEDAGWLLIDEEGKKKNVLLENRAKIKIEHYNFVSETEIQYEKGAIDYLLLDKDNFPLAVVEAKREDINPLSAKEQAKRYAISKRVKYVILSNGDKHYLWNIEKDNPKKIEKFPSQEELSQKKDNSDKESLIKEEVKEDYIALSKEPNYKTNAEYINEKTRENYIDRLGLSFLRYYQLDAVKAIQQSVNEGNTRFLFEMATGTGKTLTAAAVVKLFLKTNNASRVLFLVDRLELEQQAAKDFGRYLSNDYAVCIFKENFDNWQQAQIVITTTQTFLSKERYKRIFNPTDFDFVISDEAHRTIGGRARDVFEYFVGYKLGLTATPKDFLNKIHKAPIEEIEQRLMLDTYETFGCKSKEPTFRYTLIDGVRDKFLIQPDVIDARTDITTQLLSDEGYIVEVVQEDDQENEERYIITDFEKKFTNENTNRLFCETFMQNAMKDPINGEIGKTIIFAVSQNHASKIVQYLNQIANEMFPNKYQSNFAMQVTSWIKDAKGMTIDFANNRLCGQTEFNEFYYSSKSRVCVTVGMMTTGYDCTDILNICLFRPIFSPTDFTQIKGRGTRKHNFSKDIRDKTIRKEYQSIEKEKYYLFDFFGNYEYFNDKDYDELIPIPICSGGRENPTPPPPISPPIDDNSIDALRNLTQINIGTEGMPIDRITESNREKAIAQIQEIDRKWKEFIENDTINLPQSTEEQMLIKQYFEAYLTDESTRNIIDNRTYSSLNNNPAFNFRDFERIDKDIRLLVPQYIKSIHKS